jgi:TRAP-type mannitol/chloroaromatic compound transport system permease large subunit
VLIPPLILIFLVLGTIFLGLATPTEGGAMGALGAFVMALAGASSPESLLRQALDNTTKLSCFVMFILIGSTVFSFTFNAADGHIWVEHLFDKLPGGALGFLIIVNLLVFVLGMFIDFFEIAFIVVPLLAPVAEKILPGILPWNVVNSSSTPASPASWRPASRPPPMPRAPPSAGAWPPASRRRSTPSSARPTSSPRR